MSKFLFRVLLLRVSPTFLYPLNLQLYSIPPPPPKQKQDSPTFQTSNPQRFSPQFTMSSLADAVLSSDLPDPAPRSRPRDNPTPSSVRFSSSAPGPPDGTSDDGQMDVDQDDEVVGARGTLNRTNRPRTDLSQVPKVTDEAGDQIMNAFIGFLEK